VLPRNTNQAQGIAQFAIDFMAGKLGAGPSKVHRRPRAAGGRGGA
jgi:hypothetical protein